MKKKTVEACLVLDIKYLKDNGAFDSEFPSSGSIQWRSGASAGIHIHPYLDGPCDCVLSLTYLVNGEDVQYDIPVVSTACNYGGRRYWFLCPGVRDGIDCATRVGKLYLPGNGKYFLCRHCYDLTYKSRQVWKSVSQFGVLIQTIQLLEDWKKLERQTGTTKGRNRLAHRTAKLTQLAEQKGLL